MLATCAHSRLPKGKVQKVLNLLIQANCDVPMLQNSMLHLPASPPITIPAPLFLSSVCSVVMVPNYNMCRHIKTVHPTTNVEHYAGLYTLGPHEQESLCIGKYSRFVRVQQTSAAEKYGGMHGTASESQYYPLFFSVSLEQYYLNQ